MMRTRRTIAVVLFLAACQSSAPPPERSARAVPPATSCKPEAPIAIDVAMRAVGDDELEVTARATPTREVPSIELALALPAHANALGATTARFGATAIGEARVMTTRIRADHRTSSITAIARLPVDDVTMSRTATIAIGAPPPAPRTTVYALPDGERAREVRP